MSSFNLIFFRYARSSYQKKSACNISGASNTKKNPLFRKFFLRGSHCFTERDFLEVQIVISPLIFEIFENSFQFSTLLIALFWKRQNNVGISKLQIKSIVWRHPLWRHRLNFSDNFFVKKFGLLSSIHLPSLIRVCHVFLKLC